MKSSIEDQVNRYVNGNKDTVYALDRTKEIATAMKNALLLGHVDEFGSLLNEAWDVKKKSTPKITGPYIDEMYETAKNTGVLGGKLLGAGGGGYLLLLCEFDKWHLVASKLEKLGGKIVNFAFDFRGLQTWEVK